MLSVFVQDMFLCYILYVNFSFFVQYKMRLHIVAFLSFPIQIDLLPCNCKFVTFVQLVIFFLLFQSYICLPAV